MKKNTKVKLTQKWWKDNKAKTLVGKGNLGKTLAAFEPALKLAVVSKGAEQAKRLKVAIKLCDALDAAAAKNAKACVPKLHTDTKFVLQNSFPAEVDKHRKLLVKQQQTLRKTLASLTAQQMLKDKTYLSLYVAMAKTRYNSENVNFIMHAKKKNAAIYDEYIKEGAPQQINIDGSLRIKFDDAMQNGDIGSAPWKQAVGVCVSLIQVNDMGLKFAKFVMGD